MLDTRKRKRRKIKEKFHYRMRMVLCGYYSATCRDSIDRGPFRCQRRGTRAFTDRAAATFLSGYLASLGMRGTTKFNFGGCVGRKRCEFNKNKDIRLVCRHTEHGLIPFAGSSDMPVQLKQKYCPGVQVKVSE